jgi:pimeloyl-ACP methyl ester carboxylesterase
MLTVRSSISFTASARCRQVLAVVKRALSSSARCRQLLAGFECADVPGLFPLIQDGQNRAGRGWSGPTTERGNTMNAKANVVLVHGGFVDGSGWQAVYELLTADGYRVSVVQNPTLSLEGDVAATRQVIDAQDGPVVLVGHSYGGAVITEAGTHDQVAALVYIAAFAPDEGESVNTLIADPPPGAPVPPILPPRDGFLFLDRDKFAGSFAGDLPPELAAFMADSQVPWGVNALGGSITEPAWRTKPSWYLIATDDRMIPPPAQRAMSERAGATVIQAPGSHAIYVSQPSAVAALIHEAASAVTARQ